MMLKRVGQPRIEMHFFAIGSLHKVRFAGEQTFGGGEADKIFGRLNFAFEMFVFSFDVRDGFGHKVFHPSRLKAVEERLLKALEGEPLKRLVAGARAG